MHVVMLHVESLGYEWHVRNTSVSGPDGAMPGLASHFLFPCSCCAFVEAINVTGFCLCIMCVCGGSPAGGRIIEKPRMYMYLTVDLS